MERIGLERIGLGWKGFGKGLVRVWSDFISLWLLHMTEWHLKGFDFGLVGFGMVW